MVLLIFFQIWVFETMHIEENCNIHIFLVFMNFILSQIYYRKLNLNFNLSGLENSSYVYVLIRKRLCIKRLHVAHAETRFYGSMF